MLINTALENNPSSILDNVLGKEKKNENEVMEQFGVCSRPPALKELGGIFLIDTGWIQDSAAFPALVLLLGQPWC